MFDMFLFFFCNVDAVIILFCPSDPIGCMDTVDAGLFITINSLSLSLLHHRNHQTCQKLLKATRKDGGYLK